MGFLKQPHVNKMRFLYECIDWFGLQLLRRVAWFFFVFFGGVGGAWKTWILDRLNAPWVDVFALELLCLSNVAGLYEESGPGWCFGGVVGRGSGGVLRWHRAHWVCGSTDAVPALVISWRQERSVIAGGGRRAVVLLILSHSAAECRA